MSEELETVGAGESSAPTVSGAVLPNSRSGWPLTFILAAAAGGLVLLIFSGLAWLSWSQKSLPVTQDVWLFWLATFLCWIVFAFVACIVALLTKAWRRNLLAIVSSLGAAIALSRGILERFEFSNEQALEALIRECEPVVHAIEAFEVDQHRLPAELQELVPRYLASIPQPQIIGDPLRIQYRQVDGAWALHVGAYLANGFDCPLADLEYLSTQQYAGATSPDGAPYSLFTDSYHGWRWRTWQ